MADWNAICFDAMPGLRSGLALTYSRTRYEPAAEEIRMREGKITALDTMLAELREQLRGRRAAERKQAADAAAARCRLIAPPSDIHVEDIEIDTTPRMQDVLRGYTRLP
jgi:hypothetical protein